MSDRAHSTGLRVPDGKRSRGLHRVGDTFTYTRLIADALYLSSVVLAKGGAFQYVRAPYESGGRNNVAFVRERNGEARLKRKAKSD